MKVLSNLKRLTPSVSGCWEAKENDFVCRWLVCWFQKDDEYIGAICGYSGGGAFQLEKFCATPVKTILSFQDAYSELDKRIVSLGEDAQDIIFEYNDEERWLDTDSMYLKMEKGASMRQVEDLIFFDAKIPKKLLNIFDAIGLISRPKP